MSMIHTNSKYVNSIKLDLSKLYNINYNIHFFVIINTFIFQLDTYFSRI